MISQSCQCASTDNLSAKTVEGLSLPLEGVDDIHGSDSLTASMLGVGDRVTDDVLEEDLEHTTGLLVDETGDTLDTATTSETADGGLGDALFFSLVFDFIIIIILLFRKSGIRLKSKETPVAMKPPSHQNVLTDIYPPKP
eukprot:CAMPEP_0202028350 /NCGR_PEP_ID=MMETSP0905-20130828/63405_1 /ASSEMBLY_ACC=CAM_ASM_000554 /TAXON_ID=420261 /ORGANISM="Thalassiosira antarctica, Strain CCMP982" /LENGTH=139 /DNA_ID=CAMNT_0048592051 /DNA_START=61 /DNA_END=480 /DNA_ORIENTATION=-